jgi:hypothetical protein
MINFNENLLGKISNELEDSLLKIGLVKYKYNIESTIFSELHVEIFSELYGEVYNSESELFFSITQLLDDEEYL